MYVQLLYVWGSEAHVRNVRGEYDLSGGECIGDIPADNEVRHYVLLHTYFTCQMLNVRDILFV